MAWTGDFLCDTFKREILVALHDFTITTGSVFKMALYDNTPSFTAATTGYTVTGELPAAGNYVTGGETLTNVTPTLDTGVAIIDFPDLVWGTATFTAYGGMIYNSTAGTESVCILDFSGAKTATAGDFTVQFPAYVAATAIIRIA